MMHSKSTLSKFSSSAFCVLLSKIVAFVALFGFNAILARSLSPTEFGIFALLFSIATLACLLGSLGLNRALVKVLADGTVTGANSVRRAISFGLRVSVFSGIVVGGIGFGSVWACLPDSFAESRFWIAAAFAGIVLLRNIHFVIAETARGFHETNWSNMFGGPAGGPATHLLFLLSIAITWYVRGTLSLPLTLTLYLICFAATLPLLLIRVWSLRDSKQGTKTPNVNHDSPAAPVEKFSPQTIWALAIPLMMTQTFGLTLSQADIWMAGAMVVPASMAIYCAAQRMLALLTIPLQITGTAIVSFIPELIADTDKNRGVKKLQEMIGVATFVSGIPGIAIATVLIVFPETVLSFVFGDYYIEAATVLQILVAGQLVSVMTGPCEILLMMAGHQNKTVVVNIVSAVAILTLGAIGIYTHGIHGLAIAIGGVTALQNLANWFLAKKLVGVWTHFDPSWAPQILAQIQNRFAATKPNKAKVNNNAVS